MKMMTLLHEESKIKGKIETLMKVVSREAERVVSPSEKDELLKELQLFLENLDDIEKLVKIEDELFACDTPVELVKRMRTQRELCMT